MREVKTDKVLKALQRVGFQAKARGSHATFIHPSGAQVTLPTSQPTISGSVLQAVLRQASTVVSESHFRSLLD